MLKYMKDRSFFKKRNFSGGDFSNTGESEVTVTHINIDSKGFKCLQPSGDEETNLLTATSINQLPVLISSGRKELLTEEH